MKWSVLPYGAAYVLPLFCVWSFLAEGWLTFVPFAYAFGLIPLLEIIIKPTAKGLITHDQVEVTQHWSFDVLLFLALPVQLGFLIWMAFNLGETTPFTLTFFGRASSLGLICGVLGINVAHELGHRRSYWHRTAARLLLSSTSYGQFFTEHNYGHHKNVATESDPASARKWEIVYSFWFRSVGLGWISAWRIQTQLLQRQGLSFWSRKNDMLWTSLTSLLIWLGMYLLGGWVAVIGYAVACTVGIVLLETVNYIEHYGLSRRRVGKRQFERVKHYHSWNSRHPIGRLILFELSLHSDHHANPQKPYILLESPEGAPEFPAGYPAMMLLSLVPPLWFAAMHPRIERLKQETQGLVGTQAA